MQKNTITIGSYKIGDEYPSFIVSEIGAMYENIEGMYKLIDISKEAGVDAVKIQTYKAETITGAHAEFEFEDGTKMSQFEFFKQYEISEINHKLLFEYAKSKGILIFSTPSDYEDVDFLDSLGVLAFKTGSDDLTNHPFLKYIANKNKLMIISTGMSTISEIYEAVETIKSTGNNNIILLHCTVSYPVSYDQANLNVIQSLKQIFGLCVGYSNHVPDILAPTLASSLGANVIEVHVTLDKSLKRPDYQVSFDPEELKQLVRQIRYVAVLSGSSMKTITQSEHKWRKNSRKSIYTSKSMKKGEIIKWEDLKIIRPGFGLQPKYIDLFVGKELKKNMNENELIDFDSI